ncbi:PP2C family protein-serine/threonine phosphatase [Streptomyces flavidovirens]|uniref:PP2C family protein-serine/threonine phosphatase n=1 Tax=Streptomyces flavidovirens TaxID=67298 RepID=A0ABW6RE03_9ACTN
MPSDRLLRSLLPVCVPAALSPRGSTLAAAMPWLVWSAALVLALLTGPDVSVGPVLAAVPALAAIAHRWLGILGFGVLAAATQTVLRWGSTPLGGSALPMVTIAIVVVTVAGIAAAVAREGRERTLDHVRSLAGGVQRAVLRPLPQATKGYRLAGFYRAAEAEARVGGDFYDALQTPYGLRLVLGDVCGKGLPAVDATVTLLGAFREAAYDEPDLAAVARRMDLSLRRRQGASGDDRYATALLLQADPDGTLELVNCGHVPPILVSPEHSRELSLWPGCPLGYFEFAQDEPLRVDTHTLAPGTSLLMVTDGVTEARNGDRDFFDLETAVTGQDLGPCPQALTDALLAEVSRHAAGGRLRDDAAALALVRHSPQAPGALTPS